MSGVEVALEMLFELRVFHERLFCTCSFNSLFKSRVLWWSSLLVCYGGLFCSGIGRMMKRNRHALGSNRDGHGDAQCCEHICLIIVNSSRVRPSAA